MVQRADIDTNDVDEGSDEIGWGVLNGEDDDTPNRQTGVIATDAGRRSAAGDADPFAPPVPRLAAATRAGETRTAPARSIAPRLAESLRLDAATEPLSPAQAWLQDFLLKFLRN